MWTRGSTNEPLGGLMTFLHFPWNGSLCTIIQTEELPCSLRQHSLCGPVPCLYLLQCMRPQVDLLEGGFWCSFRVMNQFTCGNRADTRQQGTRLFRGRNWISFYFKCSQKQRLGQRLLNDRLLQKLRRPSYQRQHHPVCKGKGILGHEVCVYGCVHACAHTLAHE